MRRATFLLLAIVLLAAACRVYISSTSGTFFFSFNTGFEGWSTRGTDLQFGDGTVSWSITLTQAKAYEGSTSVELFLNNLNGEGKIWIEKPFAVKPHRTYQVTVEYALSPVLAWDELDSFRLITAALPSSPRSSADLTGYYFDPKLNGPPAPSGSQWAVKRFQFTVASGDQSSLYVVVGMWGVWDAPLSMWIDSLKVDLQEG
jgi:hypothetical protein